MRHPTSRQLLVGALLAATLCACSTSAPQARNQQTPTSIPTSAASQYKISFTYTAEQLTAALPERLGKVPLTRSASPPGWIAREAGTKWTTEPESCQAQLLNGGRTASTFADFPVLPEVEARPSDPDLLSPIVRAIPLPPAYADKYLQRVVQSAPQCRNVRIHDSGPEGTGSIVEQTVPGLGVRSRFVIVRYHRSGKDYSWMTVLFRTATYYASVECSSGSTTDCLAAARQLEATVTRTMHRQDMIPGEGPQ
ncbi:hypothetical protein OG474_19180 [Kribbella sp. NBC_01505]|uniref:hypothetical protein n=1 Tax=Kribbella sp. NBC_01505 TaxID=2903580 RepID=UPI003867B147